MLWGKSGGKCAYPNCKNDLILKTKDEIVGNICHIYSESGPRAKTDVPKDSINQYPNLILLCAHHHIIVDRYEKKYTSEILLKYKKEHEENIHQKLQVGSPWQVNVSQLYYINIPRLNILNSLEGFIIPTDFLEEYKNLHSMKFELTKLLFSYREVLEKIHPKTTPIQELNDINSNLIGLTISFNNEFITKNNPRLDHFQSGKFKMKGDIELDPQIYLQLSGYKFILTIDPQCITTTTSFVNFRLGRGNFAGLATIKDIMADKKIIIATPLIIGVPKTEPNEAFEYYNSLALKEIIQKRTTK